MNAEKIARLQDAVRAAQTALDEGMRAEFPKDAMISVFLTFGQKVPSWGVVQGVRDGHVIVRLDNAKARSRMRMRHILPQAVYSVHAPASQPSLDEVTGAGKGEGDA